MAGLQKRRLINVHFSFFPSAQPQPACWARRGWHGDEVMVGRRDVSDGCAVLRLTWEFSHTFSCSRAPHFFWAPFQPELKGWLALWKLKGRPPGFWDRVSLPFFTQSPQGNAAVPREGRADTGESRVPPRAMSCWLPGQD